MKSKRGLIKGVILGTPFVSGCGVPSTDSVTFDLEVNSISGYDEPYKLSVSIENNINGQFKDVYVYFYSKNSQLQIYKEIGDVGPYSVIKKQVKLNHLPYIITAKTSGFTTDLNSNPDLECLVPVKLFIGSVGDKPEWGFGYSKKCDQSLPPEPTAHGCRLQDSPPRDSYEKWCGI